MELPDELRLTPYGNRPSYGDGFRDRLRVSVQPPLMAWGEPAEWDDELAALFNACFTRDYRLVFEREWRIPQDTFTYMPCVVTLRNAEAFARWARAGTAVWRWVDILALAVRHGGLVGAAQAESDCRGPRAGSPCAQAGPADADSPLQAAAAPRNPG
jgi:hypothetical protein